MTDDTSPHTVVFFPEGAFGPTNNCVGIANVLRQRGHRVVFVVEESFAGTLAAKGFEERLMRLQAPPEVPEEPGQFWKDFIRDTAPHFRKSTTQQLESLILPIWEQLVSGATTSKSAWGRSLAKSSRMSSSRTTSSPFPRCSPPACPGCVSSLQSVGVARHFFAAGILRTAGRRSVRMGAIPADLLPAPR